MKSRGSSIEGREDYSASVNIEVATAAARMSPSPAPLFCLPTFFDRLPMGLSLGLHHLSAVGEAPRLECEVEASMSSGDESGH